jgi:hypothetical protein
LWSIASWSYVFFILSLGVKHLDFNNRVLAYGNEAVLPFYKLHQTVILLVGWYIIPLSMFIPLKYLTISTSSFVMIMSLYALLVKWINTIRFLFGMRALNIINFILIEGHGMVFAWRENNAAISNLGHISGVLGGHSVPPALGTRIPSELVE